MNLVPKEILLSHLQRAEGAEEVTLPIDFFRDLIYQAMPRTWVGLTDEDVERIVREARVGEHGIGYTIAKAIEAKLKQKNGFAEENT